jgi:hypothetical protein
MNVFTLCVFRPYERRGSGGVVNPETAQIGSTLDTLLWIIYHS